MIRPNGLFLPLALLLAILATAFGAMAVSSGHHHASASDHGELVPHRAEHEGDEAADVASGVGDGLAALALSILAVGLVPIGVRTTRSADPPDALRFTVAVASAGAAAVHFAVIDQHVAE